MSSELEFALELADIADRLTLARFQAVDLVVESKPDMTPVTDVDRAVEQALRARIGAMRPGHAMVGEEFGDSGGGSMRWIIDPIDGTKNYVRGIPVYATLVALEVDGRLTAAVASAPALGHRWWAARGEGAHADGRRIQVSAVSRLEDAQVCHGSLDAWEKAGLLENFLELGRRTWRSRGFGDFWTHMLVAEGRAEVALEGPGVRLWDMAAPKLIVEEAGGRVTDISGADVAGGSAVTTNGILHDQVVEILAGRPA